MAEGLWAILGLEDERSSYGDGHVPRRQTVSYVKRPHPYLLSLLCPDPWGICALLLCVVWESLPLHKTLSEPWPLPGQRMPRAACPFSEDLQQQKELTEQNGP